MLRSLTVDELEHFNFEVLYKFTPATQREIFYIYKKKKPPEGGSSFILSCFLV